ncbi:MAG: hypothetical protein QOI83_1211, partial [Streptomycetaceae bacterium]|nr:hypothetical protein [Streptomycetaceae bacterium]
ATDLAGRLPITRQAIAKHLALLAEAGLVTAEPGERRRVPYRLRSAPMQVAQQFLAALVRDWDGPLDALKDHLDRHARLGGLTLPNRRSRCGAITVGCYSGRGSVRSEVGCEDACGGSMLMTCPSAMVPGSGRRTPPSVRGGMAHGSTVR